MKQKDIVELIYKKDENSFAVLYDLYAKSLFGIISSRINDPENAEKILADVFENAWNSIETYSENNGRLYSWLVEITQKQLVEYLKNNDEYNSKQNNSFVDLLADENKPETFGVQEYVRKLRPKSIKIIDLLFFKGFSIVEVAEKLETNPEILTIENRSSINEIRNLLEA